jgi:hypothetical protein
MMMIPIVVTVVGMVTDARLVHPRKTPVSIAVILVGIVTDFSAD